MDASTDGPDAMQVLHSIETVRLPTDLCTFTMAAWAPGYAQADNAIDKRTQQQQETPLYGQG